MKYYKGYGYKVDRHSDRVVNTISLLCIDENIESARKRMRTACEKMKNSVYDNQLIDVVDIGISDTVLISFDYDLHIRGE